MKVKRLLALAMTLVFMLSAAQTTALEAYAVEIPVVEEQSEEGVLYEETAADLVTDQTEQVDQDIEEDSATEYIDVEDASIEDITYSSEEAAESEESDSTESAEEEDTAMLMSTEKIFFLDANGGVFPNGELTKGLYELTSGLSEKAYRPTRDGFFFAGWYKSPDCSESSLVSKYTNINLGTGVYDLTEFPVEGMTLYAGWRKAVTVTLKFGEPLGRDPINNTGYFWDKEKQRRFAQIQISVPQYERLTSDTLPVFLDSRTRNRDAHYRFNSKWYADAERTEDIGLLKDYVPTDDVVLYPGYVLKDNIVVVTFITLDPEASFDIDNYNIRDESGYIFHTMQCSDSNFIHVYENDAIKHLKHTNPRMAIEGIYKDIDCTQKMKDYITAFEDTELYVKWTDSNKVVTFDANGGFFFDPDNKNDRTITQVKIGKEATSAGVNAALYPDMRIKNTDQRKRFVGWARTPNATVPEFSCGDNDTDTLTVFTPLTSDLEFYAVWKDEYYIITLNADDKATIEYVDPLTDDCILEPVNSAEIRTYLDGRIYSTPYRITPKSEDYIFKNWYIGDTEITNLHEYNFTGDTVVTAKFYDSYKITLDAGEDGVIRYRGELQEYFKVRSTSYQTDKDGKIDVLDDYTEPYDPDKKAFFGWYDEDGNLIEDLESHVFTKSETLTAGYADVYHITFNSEDGDLEYYGYDDQNEWNIITAKTVTFPTDKYGHLTDYPYDPEADSKGNEFIGWYDSNNVKVSDFDTFVFTGDETLTAYYAGVFLVGPKEISLPKDSSATVNAIIEPSLESQVTWSSDNKSVATVTERGSTATITAVAEGKATITAAVGNDKKTVKVTVVKKAEPIVLDKTELFLSSRAGVSEMLQATLSGEALGKKVTWTVEGDGAVTVTPSGAGTRATVVPVADLKEVKTATVKATVAGTQFTAECKVIVNPVATVEKPVASVASGSVKKDKIVTLSTETHGADIFYTENGSDPVVGEDGKCVEPTRLYKDGFRITDDKTIKAIAWKKGMNSSAVETFAYTINKEDWGELDAEAKALFMYPSEVPSGVWFMPGDSQYYTAGAVTAKQEPYTGNKITFNSEVKVYHGTSRLIENRDYTLTFANNTAAAAANIGAKAPKVTVKGKGNYTSSEVFCFTITPADINDAVITSEKNVVAAVDSKLANVKPVVSFAGKTLRVNKDYVLEYYKGEQKISDAELKNYKVESGALYKIKVTGMGGDFEAATKTDDVTVKAYDSKNKNIVQAGKLKVVDDKNKAIKLTYTGEATDFETLFDNSEGKNAKYFVKNGKATLVYNRDYTIAPDDSDHKSAGNHSFTIVGSERALTDDDIAAGEKSYYGCKTITYSITGFTMKQVKITGLLTSVEYTGKEISDLDISNPKIVLTNSKTKDELEVSKDGGLTGDYTIAMDNLGTLGKFNVVFTGINGYEGTVTKIVTVKTYNIKNDAKKKIGIEVAEGAVYSKTGARPAVTVEFDGKPLKEGSDYTLAYKNNFKVADKNEKGAPAVTVTGKGNFTGANATKTFSISKGDVKKIVLTADDVNYNEKGKNGYFKVVPKLTESGKAVSAGKKKDVDTVAKTAYVYTYAADTVLGDKTKRHKGQNVEDTDKVLPGTEIMVSANVTCQDSKTYGPAAGGEICGFYKIIENGMNIKSAKASIKKEALNSGKLSYHDTEEVTPLKSEDIDVTMKVKGKNVTLKPEDYEVVSVTNNKFLGTATVTIKGKGAYGGTKSFTFKISAKKF